MPQYDDPARNEFCSDLENEVFNPWWAPASSALWAVLLCVVSFKHSVGTTAWWEARWHWLLPTVLRASIKISLPGSNLFPTYLHNNNYVTSRFSWAVNWQGHFHLPGNPIPRLLEFYHELYSQLRGVGFLKKHQYSWHYTSDRPKGHWSSISCPGPSLF